MWRWKRTGDLAAWFIRYPLLLGLGISGRVSWWIVLLFLLAEVKVEVEF